MTTKKPGLITIFAGSLAAVFTAYVAGSAGLIPYKKIPKSQAICVYDFLKNTATIVKKDGVPVISGRHFTLHENGTRTTSIIQAADQQKAPDYMVVKLGDRYCRTGSYTWPRQTKYEMADLQANQKPAP